jgi:DNA-binding CsgD family transcriptional regulator
MDVGTSARLGDAVEDLIGRIYEAVEQPELWPETIEQIGRFIGGRNDFWSAGPSVFQSQRNPAAWEAGCHGTFLLSRSDLRDLDQYAAEFDKLIIRFLRLIFLSVLWSNRDIGPREAMGARVVRRYLLGREVSRPNDHTARHLIAAMWEDGRMFDRRNLQLMKVLASHLDRAARLQTRLNLAALHNEMVTGALDRLTLGIVFFDKRGAKLWHNKQAQEIASDPEVLSLSSNRLIGGDASSTQSLRALIEGAVSEDQPGLLAIDRHGSRPLLLIAAPLRARGSHDSRNESSREGACGVVFISDPDRSDNFTIESLRSAFDLTCREAQMAIAIAQGHGLKAAARAIGVAPTTARSQLQQVFAKTNTSHQAELAALVHRTLTHLRRD